jgi:WhiB family transcriptional regulator, redox-sensing transcriptional regulator
MTRAQQAYPRALESDWEWQLDGSCRSYPSQLFFPEDGERGRGLRQREERAKRICRRCPVLELCRDHALRQPENFGIWGAMTALERSRSLSPR